MRTFTIEHIKVSENPPYTPIRSKKTYFIDESKSDYEICFRNGDVYVQDGPFHWETADWNNDGDFYDCFGAIFRCGNGKQFYELHDLADLIDEGVATIEGITVSEG